MRSHDEIEERLVKENETQNISSEPLIKDIIKQSTVEESLKQFDNFSSKEENKLFKDTKLWKILHGTFPQVLELILPLSASLGHEGKVNQISENMFVMLNENMSWDNIVSLIQDKYLEFQWLGLYLKFNKKCHAEDIIKMIDTKFIHPILVFSFYEYPTPDDFVKIYEKFHKKTIEQFEGISVEIGLKDLIPKKSVEYLSTVFSSVPSMDVQTSITKIFYYGQQLERAYHTSKDSLLTIKYVNNPSELKVYNQNFSKFSDNKVAVRFNKNILKELRKEDDLVILLEFFTNYWNNYLKNDYPICFTNIQNKTGYKDICEIDSSINMLIYIKHLADEVNEKVNLSNYYLID